MSSPRSESDYGQLDHPTHTLRGPYGAAKSTPPHTESEYLRDFVKVGELVNAASFNRFLQERRVQDLQLSMDELELPYPVDSQGPEEGEILEDDISTQMYYGDTEANTEALHRLVEASKTTALVLSEVLQLVFEVQKSVRGLEQRVYSLEKEVSRSPQPKTSCGFSCSNNSVTID